MSSSSTAGRELLGRGSIYTVATAVQLSGGLLILPAATRLLGPREYGAVATALVIVQVFSMSAALGLPGAITRSYFSPRLGTDAASSLIGAGLGLTVLVGLGAFATAPYWGAVFGEFGGRAVVSLALLTAVLMALVQCAQALLRARGEAWRFAAVVGVSSVGGQAAGLGLAYAIRPQAVWYVVGMAMGGAVGALLGLMYSGVRAPRWLTLRWGLALGLPTVPHSLALYVISAGDRVIVERYLGLEAVGGYYVAYIIGALGVTLLSALNNAWAPMVYGATAERRTLLLVETSDIVHRLGASIAAALALAAPIGLRIAAPAAFGLVELVPVVAIVSLATIAQATYLSNVHLLFQHQRTRSLMLITPAVAATNVGLNLLLVPRYGLVAAAASTALAYALQAYLVSRVRLRLEVVPWRRRSQSVSYAIAGVGCALGGFLPSQSIWLLVRAGFVVPVALIAVHVLRSSWRSSPAR